MKKGGKIIAIVLVVVLVVLGAVFIPRLVHKCDDCGKTFVGTGYEPNAIVGIVSDEEKTICKDCAEKQHAIGTALGASLDDFKKDLF